MNYDSLFAAQQAARGAVDPIAMVAPQEIKMAFADSNRAALAAAALAVLHSRSNRGCDIKQALQGGTITVEAGRITPDQSVIQKLDAARRQQPAVANPPQKQR